MPTYWRENLLVLRCYTSHVWQNVYNISLNRKLQDMLLLAKTPRRLWNLEKILLKKPSIEYPCI